MNVIDRFQPGELWPDTDGAHINAHGGGVLFHDGSYYWFGEHKVAGEIGNTAQVGVRCYSSTDLYNWTNRGVALAVSDDPASPIARGCVIERPKVIYNPLTRLFVMWFHLEGRDRNYRDAMAGVTVSERVTGPYRFVSAGRVNAGVWPMNAPPEDRRPLDADESAGLTKLELLGGPSPAYPTNLIYRRDFAGGQMSRDMTLFVDDDGVAYHLHASEENGVLHISQLSEDYQRPAGRYIRVFPGGFHEAPAIFKHAGKYWLITSGCTGWFPNAARLAVASSIWGPWESLGNPCVGPRAEITFDG
ncbi:MAG TPA: glycoside hydrolase family 43 protein, partial [Tepidisphaeraceae bacterium]|nr:glycoside hydrolase family 43 protein [Tepidisphaeraceae bacterium]